MALSQAAKDEVIAELELARADLTAKGVDVQTKYNAYNTAVSEREALAGKVAALEGIVQQLIAGGV